MKITLTKEQVEQLRRSAQAEQEKAYKSYIEARERYNKVLSIGGELDLEQALLITSTLPEIAPRPVPQPEPVVKYGLKRYYAYSRSGRKDGNQTAVHYMEVWRDNMFGVNTIKCSCPGYINHGYCWASTEALLIHTGKSKTGTKGVYARS